MGADAAVTLAAKTLRKGRGFRLSVTVALAFGLLIYLVGLRIPSPLLILLVAPASLSAVFTDIYTYESIFYALMIVGSTQRFIRWFALLITSSMGCIIASPYLLLGALYFGVGWVVAAAAGASGIAYLYNSVEGKMASEK